MSMLYGELVFRETLLGYLMLRRRQSIQLHGLDVYEVKLGGPFSHVQFVPCVRGPAVQAALEDPFSSLV